MRTSATPDKHAVPSDSELFPIRTVSALTGVNSITLRAWERRYGLIQPQRTPKGHRLYTQQDIDLINQVLELLDKGLPISQVKRRLQSPTSVVKTSGDPSPWEQFQQRMLNAVVRFDEYALDDTYNEALSIYPIDMVTQRLIIPLLRTLGERWESSDGSVAEEHLFGSYLRNKLGARFHHRVRRGHGPKIIAACLPGEHHEVGLMLFCLSAIERDYRLILLGADLPLEELPAVVQRTGARAIVLSGSIKPSRTVLQEQMTRLHEQVNVPIFVGGETSISHSDAIVRSGAIPVGKDITHALRQLDDSLKPRPAG
ncbi:MAG: MerR family transcriptional regulator [Proteobacteria bacterium]|nr:MAG: MerR family transcriptional regulator [Pseudomonadota bacterium]